MKDFIAKGTGNSRFLKSISNFLTQYPDYNSFAQALIAGTLPVDFNGFNAAGVAQVGTDLSKANLLTDATATALELTGDPTVNQALYALSQKTQPAVLYVTTTVGVTVTATKGSKVLSAVANAQGIATLYPNEFGIWTLTATISGKTVTLPFEIDAIAVFRTTLTTNLELASWDLVHAVAEAGNASSLWSIGDTKTITVNGVSYVAQIIGFSHDNKSSGGKAGITFQLQNCLSATAQMNSSNTNVGGWTNSAMRQTRMNDYFAQLSEDLQKVIVPVNKLTSAGNQLATINTDSDKVFLLSEVEIFGSISYSKAGEGSQYAYYAAGNSKVKTVNGSADYWWERSPRGSNATSFCRVSNNGNASSNDASYSYGVSFGFCV